MQRRILPAHVQRRAEQAGRPVEQVPTQRLQITYKNKSLTLLFFSFFPAGRFRRISHVEEPSERPSSLSAATPASTAVISTRGGRHTSASADLSWHFEAVQMDQFCSQKKPKRILHSCVNVGIFKAPRCHHDVLVDGRLVGIAVLNPYSSAHFLPRSSDTVFAPTLNSSEPHLSCVKQHCSSALPPKP